MNPDEIRARALGVKLDTPIPLRLKREVADRWGNVHPEYIDGWRKRDILAIDERNRLMQSFSGIERENRWLRLTTFLLATALIWFAVTRGQ